MDYANTNGRISNKISGANISFQERMAIYDSLPREARDILKYSTLSVLPGDPELIRGEFIPLLAETIRIAERESTLLTYGNDYPMENV